MPISKFVLAVCMCLSFTVASCSTPRSYEYYLDKDETHRDVYKFNASIHSDATCEFSIGDSESYTGLLWTDPEDMRKVAEAFAFGGICYQYPPKISAETNDYISVPKMYLHVYIAKDTDVAILRSGILLDVIPRKKIAPYNNPAGVYFIITNPQTIEKPKGLVCSLGLYSLKGEAFLQSMPDGETKLSISALVYAADQGCF